MNCCLRRPSGDDFGLRYAARVLLLGFAVILTACTGPKTVGSADPPAAPTISAQPESQSVAMGATATFSVTAASTAPLSYRWSKNGTAIDGAIEASYTTPPTVAGDDGAAFTVEVANVTGNATSNEVTLTVTSAVTAPSITSQPANQSVAVGGTAIFSVTATGTAPLSYQWSKNNAPINGATSSSYTTPATVIGDNGATFTVEVINGVGSAVSAAATLSVTSTAVAPSITTQPADQMVGVGAKATFTVLASGSAPLTYQWSKNGAAITGATAASYTTPATVIGDNGASYSVQVTNSAGNASSNAATLTVNNVAPTITAQPKNQTANLGATATFVVTATGTNPLTFQWLKNGITIPGATASSYTTPATLVGDNDTTFSVRITNSAGNVLSSAATLTVKVAAPAITAQPKNQSVLAGGAAAFSVTATGTAPLTYQWFKKGTVISGATAASYTTPATVIGDSGATFTVKVTNSAGTVTSNAATLTVTAAATAPTIVSQPANQSVTVGTSATFSVTASGTAPLTYQWSKGGAVISGATGASYTTPATALIDSGKSFTVKVTNTAGNVTSAPAILTVSGIAPTITSQPQNQSVAVGKTATFSVSASGNPTPTYQWSKNGAAISGATGASYTTPVTALTDTGSKFTVVASNTVGNVASNPATLTVTGVPPTITTQPLSQTVVVGATATFSVIATGPGTLSYQWYKGSAQISGATASSYTTPATVIGDNATTFSVKISNTYGNVISNAATLTVSAAGTGVSVTPQLAPLTTSQTQQFTATVASSSITANWSVDGQSNNNGSGGNATVGTITSGGLYTPGTAIGTHTILAVNASNSAQSGSATVALTDLAGIYSFHDHAAGPGLNPDEADRTGQNLHEYALTPAVVKGTNFGKVWSCPVDGAVYAQPLYVANLSIGGITHNVVYIATEHDSVYAFDADSSSCATIWTIHLVKLDGSVTSVPAGDTGCGDTPTEIGITGTPAIDPSTQTLYFVAKTKEPNPADPAPPYIQRLHRVSITTGAEQSGYPLLIAASTTVGGVTNTFNALHNHQKPSLALANGAVYVGWSSHCDLPNNGYVGWLLSYDASSLSQTGVLDVTPTTPNGQGGIWMSGGAPAVDSSGSVYVSSGNGSFSSNAALPLTSPFDLSMSFIKLDSRVAPVDFYSPGNEANWSASDLDISSSGVTVLPDIAGSSAHLHLLFGSDKQNHLWLLDRDNMGGFSTFNDNSLQHIMGPPGCGSTCVFSTPGYYNQTLYVGVTSVGIVAMPMSNGLIATSGAGANAAISSQTVDTFGFPGPTPSITASPTTGAVVWALETSQNGANGKPTGPAVLRAYDATNLSTKLYSSSTLAADMGPSAVKFTVPTVANGRVYVGGVKAVTVYGPLH